MTINRDTASSNDLYHAERWSLWSSELAYESVPVSVSTIIQQLLIDTVGLCVAACNTDYIRALSHSCDSRGGCTAIGHNRTLNRFDAALIVTLNNGEQLELDQPHLRGGVHERLSPAELDAKYYANTVHGGWRIEKSEHAHKYLAALLHQGSLDDSSFLRD